MITNDFGICYNSLDAGGETRVIAFDISKAFDKVWHAGLLHKLKAYGVIDPILRFLESFLDERPLKVFLVGRLCLFISTYSCFLLMIFHCSIYGLEAIYTVHFQCCFQQTGSLYRVQHFLTPESILYLYKSTIRPCMEYCSHIWGGDPRCHGLDLLDRVHKWVSRKKENRLAMRVDMVANIEVI